MLGGGKIGFLFSEREVTRPGAVGGCKAGQFRRAVAKDFPPELFGDLLGSERHGVMGRDWWISLEGAMKASPQH